MMGASGVLRSVRIVSLMVVVVLLADVTPVTAQAVDAPSRQALLSAVNREYNARVFHSAVIAEFGQVRPLVLLIVVRLGSPGCAPADAGVFEPRADTTRLSLQGLGGARESVCASCRV